MRTVAVLGKGSLAIRMSEYFLTRPEAYQMLGVVPVWPEPIWTESLADWCRAAGVPVFEHHRKLPSGIDLVLSCFYERILRSTFIDRQKRVINVHNSPLPRYRGVNPINWALKNGELEHGVTIHEITPGIDAGPILGQVKYSIYPDIEEVCDVYARALEYAWRLFQDVLPRIDQIQARAQDHSRATYYSKADRARLGERLSWTRSDASSLGSVPARADRVVAK